MDSYLSIVLNCSLSGWSKVPGFCRWCNAELTGRRTSWCSKACSQTFLDNHYWAFAREECLRRDQRQCIGCGADWHANLQVNHITPILGKHGKTGCWHHLDGLETLCHACHVNATNAQRAAGLFGKKNVMLADKLFEVIES